MNSHQEMNRRRWDELVPIHADSAFYDVASFKAGRSTLKPIETKEPGDVNGQTLLHLQCHFGLDTLSWARSGAQVTGVDFSAAAIDRARALAAETVLPARFICARVEDLRAWAHTIAQTLKPSGVFYMIEMHPFADVFDDGANVTGLNVSVPYFFQPEPIAWEAQGSYAERGAVVQHKISHVWSHSLGEIVTVLLDAGLQLEFLHEFQECCFQRYPFMTQDATGMWRLPDSLPSLPMTFSLRARRGQGPGAAGNTMEGQSR